MRILATSGGFLPSDTGAFQWRRGPLIDHAIHLAGDPGRPRFCYIGTAAGDSLNGIAGYYRAFAGSDVRASHLELFMMPNVPDIALLPPRAGRDLGRRRLGRQPARGLAGARLDEILRECWEAGVVLGGVSAGSICWYVGGPTDSYGVDLQVSPPGLALLPYGNGVHYDSEEQRRPLLHKLVGDGILPTSHATDDGVGLVYEGTRSSKRSRTGRAWRRTSSSASPTAASPRSGSSRASSADHLVVS